MFGDKWMELPESKREEILAFSMEHGAWEGAQKYASEAGMAVQSMYVRLRKIIPLDIQQKTRVEREKARMDASKPGEVETELTAEEEVFLERVKNGDVSLEEASRKIAGIVFEKMLRNPGNVKFDTFFKTKLLELKQSEVANQNNLAMSLINGMFNGRLPPKLCPNCGHVLYQEAVIVDSPKGATLEAELDND